MISHSSSTIHRPPTPPRGGRATPPSEPSRRPDADRHGGRKSLSHAPLSLNKRLHNLSFFARQMHVLMTCGTPVVQALEALRRQANEEAWEEVVREVRDQVEQGESLAAAMRRHPLYFNSITCTLVEAGESSGSLEVMLDRVSTLARQRLALRRSITSVLIYPALLLTAATGALIVIMTLVVPRFEEMFDNLGVPLPVLTEIMLDVSDIIRTKWWLVLGAVFAVGITGLLALRSPAGRRAVDTIVVRIPKFGPIIRQFATARLARLLGVLIDSHVPLQESIRLTRGAMRNLLYVDILDTADDAVGRGEPLSSALNNPLLISPSVYEAVRSGEQAGQVGPLLVTVADFLDEDNQITVRSLTSLIEPLILIFMGLLIGLVAVSLFLPLFDLTAMAQGG